MPNNKKSEVWDNKGKLFINEEPKTTFLDEISSIEVSLVSSIERETLYRLFNDVANISWLENCNASYEESIKFLKTLIKGGMLPLALEMNNFTFLIKNITRITTHAIVRGRVGITYAQQSTGNSDQRHCDILVPRSFTKQNEMLIEDYIKYCLESKFMYSKAVDKGMSVQEARVFLPSTNANKMYVSFNLASLMNFFSKRSDRTEEYLQGNEICRQIKEIFNKKYPELSPVLRSSCGKTCAHSKNSPYVNGVYLPSKEDDVFDWNEKSFLYNKTRDEMCWNEISFETISYVGNKKI